MKLIQNLRGSLDAHPWSGWYLWLLAAISLGYLVAVFLILLG
jgi:hypothetical protein